MPEAAVLQEAWQDEFMAFERTFSIYQFLLLMKVAAGEQGMGALEPVWPWLDDADSLPLWQAPFVVPRGSLLEMAQARELIERGYLEIPQDQEATDFVLTDKGQEAVNWWVGTLEDIGFRHKTLAADY